MTVRPFTPTAEQARIIDHSGSAFVASCPGSGKTRVLVERARKLLANRRSRSGIAFLSFTIAAVSELEGRLRFEGLLHNTAFPHFIGTFDSFLWQFLIAPFGAPGCSTQPRLIPDKDERRIKPFPTAQALPLECFDRTTGSAIPDALARHGFRGTIKAYETVARNTRTRFLERGELDFADARAIALGRLRDPVSSPVLACALAARFQELVVDEAQDCNPADLEIINWFRVASIPVKVICDPNQAIYGFRGGVVDELTGFGESFDVSERLPITGNFRSSQHIAKAIGSLRAPNARLAIDEALGEYRDESTPVYVLAYPGNSVPASVGVKFRELTEGLELDARHCPVVAARTRLAMRPTAVSRISVTDWPSLSVTIISHSNSVVGRTPSKLFTGLFSNSRARSVTRRITSTSPIQESNPIRGDRECWNSLMNFGLIPNALSPPMLGLIMHAEFSRHYFRWLESRSTSGFAVTPT